ncbi:MAG: hypothetical protein H6617_08485 [Bdellovibrionaceae bacterium]|nr:hypothetical protein [Pseudobdellovibrionaceae bacterium]
MSWKIHIPKLRTETADAPEAIIRSERTAIHSGRLGDIVYSLPTCRALGINHLVLNAYTDCDNPRRTLTFRAAKEMIPLLLHQPYISRVSLSECDLPLDRAWEIEGIHYNFDRAHAVDRRFVAPVVQKLPRRIQWFSDESPVHLAQIYAASQGLHVNPEEPWLSAPKNDSVKDTIVVSLTPRWRTYPKHYWKTLLSGLAPVVFVGHPQESELDLPGAEWVETSNHLELASLIAGARLFLGTVSFPYALAEAMKVLRAVEPCYRQLDAFPIGSGGYVLPANPLLARRLVSRLLQFKFNSNYSLQTRRFYYSVPVQARTLSFCTQLYVPRLVRLYWQQIRQGLQSLFRSLSRRNASRHAV